MQAYTFVDERSNVRGTHRREITGTGRAYEAVEGGISGYGAVCLQMAVRTMLELDLGRLFVPREMNRRAASVVAGRES